MDEYNEKQSFTLVANCTNEDTNLQTPDELTYSLYDLTNEKFIIENTIITPTSSSVPIPIVLSNQLIQNRENEEEERLLTVQWNYGSGAYGDSLVYKYLLKKLTNL
jgi:hypothetical protein